MTNTIQQELERLNERLEFYRTKLIDVKGNVPKHLVVESKIRETEREINHYEIILHTIKVMN